MGYMIAITGKGGTGKTSISACLVRTLIENDVHPVLVVDADPNATLAPLLGIKPGTTISDIRREMLESKMDVTGISKDRLLEMKLEECIEEASGFDLLTMGCPEGPSCYCYVNNLLRSALKRLKSSYQGVLVDNEAGMEHLSRMNTEAIDCLVMVCEPTLVSVRTIVRIMELAKELPVEVHRQVLVWNKVLPGGVPDKVREKIDESFFDQVVQVPHSTEIGQFSAFEENVLTAAPLPGVFKELLDAVGNGKL